MKNFKFFQILLFIRLRFFDFSSNVTLKIGPPPIGPFPDLALYKTSLKISVPEVVAYKTSVFNIFTPKWLLITRYGDFVSGLITSPPCTLTVK